MSKIKQIQAKSILDSRGNKTVEVTIETDDGFSGTDSVPSGTSTGTHEAALVSVDDAIKNIHDLIAPALIGLEVTEQSIIDQKMIELDGTPNKTHLGGNAILGVSLAVSRTAAASQHDPLYKYLNQQFSQVIGENIKMKLPMPMMVMICGGKHADNDLSIQEFLIEGEVQDGLTIYKELENIFKNENIEAPVGLEGAFAPKINDNKQALQFLTRAIENVKDKLKGQVKLGLDIAGNNSNLTSQEVVDLFTKYNLYTIEDPFGENDWEKFGQLKLELEETGIPFLLIGDDLFATRKDLLQKGITSIVANGIIIKPNQVGTLTEVFEVMKLARKANFKCIVSHRSGETIDSFIADLAVATAASFIKSGAPIPKERLVKYERLNVIANELNE